MPPLIIWPINLEVFPLPTRRQYSAEEKIRIVLEGLRGKASIAELRRKEGIAQSMYYRPR